MDDAPATPVPTQPLADLDVPLDRDRFVRSLLRELAGTLEDVVGMDEASGFISVVGRTLGESIDADYRAAMGVERLDAAQVADVLIDLKRRIDGDFHLISIDADRIVLGNRRCPFGEMVADRRSLCTMTSTVFGSIAADNLGYARVELEETIARGDAGCRVVVHLRPGTSAGAGDAREYFGRD